MRLATCLLIGCLVPRHQLRIRALSLLPLRHTVPNLRHLAIVLHSELVTRDGGLTHHRRALRPLVGPLARSLLLLLPLHLQQLVRLLVVRLLLTFAIFLQPLTSRVARLKHLLALLLHLAALTQHARVLFGKRLPLLVTLERQPLRQARGLLLLVRHKLNLPLHSTLVRCAAHLVLARSHGLEPLLALPTLKLLSSRLVRGI